MKKAKKQTATQALSQQNILKVLVTLLVFCAVLLVIVYRNNNIKIQNALEQAEEKANSYDYSSAIAILTDANSKLKSMKLQKQIDLYTQENESMKTVDVTQIPHIFFHSLIVDTGRAFSSEGAKGYNKDMVTVKEFKAILNQLYENNYVLVSLHDIAEETENGFVAKSLNIPAKKRPLIMSQDDVNYAKTMSQDGFANKLVVEDGKVVCEYTDENGVTTTGNYDLIPILDEFIEEHPDFSYQGAKAIIAVTGSDGVYGYHNVIDPTKSNYREECEAVRSVAECLRNSGYELASHSYAHVHTGTITLPELKDDVKKWQKYVGSLIGETDIYIYPHGEDLTEVYKGTEDAYKLMQMNIYDEIENYKPLYDAGFRYFLNVDSSDTATTQICHEYVRQPRKNIDGYRLAHPSSYLAGLIYNLDLIWDTSRPLMDSSYQDNY